MLGNPDNGAHTPVPGQERADADREQRAHPGQSPAVRTRGARPEDREDPDRLGLARADGLSQDRRPARGGALAAAPGAPARARAGTRAGALRRAGLCRHPDAERSARLQAAQPARAGAAALIADPIVRNRGTLGGSLRHADPQGDWASVMLALGGSVVAAGPGGRRTIPMADFVTGPFQNVLEPDEIALEAVIPAAKGAPSGGYLKLQPPGGDFAPAGVSGA